MHLSILDSSILLALCTCALARPTSDTAQLQLQLLHELCQQIVSRALLCPEWSLWPERVTDVAAQKGHDTLSVPTSFHGDRMCPMTLPDERMYVRSVFERVEDSSGRVLAPEWIFVSLVNAEDDRVIDSIALGCVVSAEVERYGGEGVRPVAKRQGLPDRGGAARHVPLR